MEIIEVVFADDERMLVESIDLEAHIGNNGLWSNFIDDETLSWGLSACEVLRLVLPTAGPGVVALCTWEFVTVILTLTTGTT